MSVDMNATKQASGVREALNRQLANFSVLYVKLHRYHWYVKGPQFYELHVKFEELYNEAAARVDELAERLLAIGGQPAATMADYLKLASVREGGGEADAIAMVRALTADFDAVGAELGTAIKSAEEQGDPPTADLLIGILADLQKHNWMLRAFAG